MASSGFSWLGVPSPAMSVVPGNEMEWKEAMLSRLTSHSPLRSTECWLFVQAQCMRLIASIRRKCVVFFICTL